MPLDPGNPSEGVITLQRHGVAYTGRWVSTDNRLFVYWNLQQDSALLDIFDEEPETLARILLSELVSRELEKYDTRPKLP